MGSLQSQAVVATLQRRGAFSELAESAAGLAARGRSEPSPEDFVMATPAEVLGPDDELATALHQLSAATAKLDVMTGVMTQLRDHANAEIESLPEQLAAA